MRFAIDDLTVFNQDRYLKIDLRYPTCCDIACNLFFVWCLWTFPGDIPNLKEAPLVRDKWSFSMDKPGDNQ
jgi:hypothetical protein